MNLAIIATLALSVSAAAATTTARAEERIRPNMFTCEGDGISLIFVTSGNAGQPTFSYHEGDVSISKIGESQIRRESTAIGTLVTVELRYMPDRALYQASLLVPIVTLEQRSDKASFTAPLLKTTRHSTIRGDVAGVATETATTSVECQAVFAFF